MIPELVELTDPAWDQEPPCEDYDHAGLLTAAHWMDVRNCGCVILKCDACAAHLRYQFRFKQTWTCHYCRGVLGAGHLNRFVHLEPLPCL